MSLNLKFPSSQRILLKIIKIINVIIFFFNKIIQKIIENENFYEMSYNVFKQCCYLFHIFFSLQSKVTEYFSCFLLYDEMFTFCYWVNILRAICYVTGANVTNHWLNQRLGDKTKTQLKPDSFFLKTTH